MSVIVVGVDGSEPAAQAALTAARLASALGCELRVVSAYGRLEVERIETDRELVFTSAEDARVVVEQTSSRILTLYPHLEVVSQAASGKAAEALLAVAELVDADLVVVGNKRVQGVSRMLGSIAAELARKSPCDLYIVHTHARR